jgi:hypothetical protein
VLFWSSTPFHRDAQLCRYFAKVFERPAFGRVAGEGVDDGKVLNSCRRDSYRRHTFRRRRERGEKREGEMAYGIAKLGTMGPVPGINGVEGFQLGDAGAIDDAQQIEAGVGESPGAAGEPDQGEQRAGSPDFGVWRAGGFERGERENDVADRTGADQQAATSPLRANG